MLDFLPSFSILMQRLVMVSSLQNYNNKIYKQKGQNGKRGIREKLVKKFFSGPFSKKIEKSNILLKRTCAKGLGMVAIALVRHRRRNGSRTKNHREAS